MTLGAIRTKPLKWVVAALLTAMFVGAAAMTYWLPASGYIVTCKKSDSINCELQREASRARPASQIALGTYAVATIKIQPRRRGPSRVFLYLSTRSQAIFAAEFEGSAAVARAEAAAAELNRVFASDSPFSARIVVRAPAYLTWLTWGGVGLLGLFVLAICRELFSARPRPGKPDKSTPPRCVP